MLRAAALTLGFAAALALGACGSPQDAGRAPGAEAAAPPPAVATPSPPVLVRGNGAEPDSLDPQRARTVESGSVLRDMYETLTTIGRNGEPAPGVAREWSVSADGLAWTFVLRPEARWSNGDPVVAEDYVAALRRLVDPATASMYAQVVDAIRNARTSLRRVRRLPHWVSARWTR